METFQLSCKPNILAGKLPECLEYQQCLKCTIIYQSEKSMIMHMKSNHGEYQIMGTVPYHLYKGGLTWLWGSLRYHNHCYYQVSLCTYLKPKLAIIQYCCLFPDDIGHIFISFSLIFSLSFILIIFSNRFPVSWEAFHYRLN